MNCLEVRDALSDLIDGDLSHRQREEIENHLAACSVCSAELRSLKSLLMEAASLPRSIEPAHDLWTGIAQRISPGRARNHLPPAGIPVRRNGISVRSDESTQSEDMPPPKRTTGRRVLAIAAMLVVIVGGAWYASGVLGSSWSVSGLEGSPTLGTNRLAQNARLEEGELVETDALSRAKISNAIVGSVDVGPNTRVRLINRGAREHRFALERGTIRASTWVPPHVFVVETPSAVAIDLGCEYRLMVDDAGTSQLLVTAGWVALEWNGRESIVPAAALCQTRPAMSPGTPFSEYASDSLRQALERFDFAEGGIDALDMVLAQSRQRDAVTLWHLIARAGERERPRVFDRLASFVPPPPGVTRDGVLRLDQQMLGRWWDAFEPVPLSGLRSKPSSWSVVWYDLMNLIKEEAP